MVGGAAALYGRHRGGVRCMSAQAPAREGHGACKRVLRACGKQASGARRFVGEAGDQACHGVRAHGRTGIRQGVGLDGDVRVDHGKSMTDAADAAGVVAAGTVCLMIVRAGMLRRVRCLIAVHVLGRLVHAVAMQDMLVRIAVVHGLRVSLSRCGFWHCAGRHGCSREPLEGQGHHQQTEHQGAQGGHVGAILSETRV